MTSRIDTLHAERPRSLFLRTSAALLCALPIVALLSGVIDVTGMFEARRLDNLERFLTVDIVPRELRGDVTLSGWAGWAWDVWVTRGASATWATLQIATVAIVLAGAFALLVAAFGTRSLMGTDPYMREASGARARVTTGLSRGIFIGERAIPEYVWAFLFTGFFLGSAWPPVLALAIHNSGILGRLFADTLENVPRRSPRALAGLGAGRGSIVSHGLLPDSFPRLLAYFFYRFETCIREATVLGLLGVFSIGWLVDEARARQDHAEMLLAMIFGGGIVLAADLLSRLARRFARNA
jgi:phosphonate transport system permease protein